MEGNLIENCGDAGIALTNSEDAVVRDNMILNNGQERGPSGPTGVCLFSLGITVPDRERETRNILIEDNIIGNIETMSATQANAISGWKSADGALFRNITVKDNIYGCLLYTSRCV